MIIPVHMSGLTCRSASASWQRAGTQAVLVQLIGNVSVTRVKNLQIVNASGRDVSGTLRLSWFNMPYLKNALKPGSVYVFRGRVSRTRSGLTMEQPLMYTPENYESLQGRLRPVIQPDQRTDLKNYFSGSGPGAGADAGQKGSAAGLDQEGISTG